MRTEIIEAKRPGGPEAPAPYAPLFHLTMESPAGALKLVAGDSGLTAVLWEGDKPGRVPLGRLEPDDRHPVLLEARRQLEDYFAGRLETFSLKLNFRGTEFQKRVWRALLEIPFGETRTYAWVAGRTGSPKASRAAGAANGKNPLSIIVPCHRVIGAGGALTGFAGGLEVKRLLLDLEAKNRRGAALKTFLP